MSLPDQTTGTGEGAQDPLRLAELLCARFSHDLSGIVTGLAGALDSSTDPAVPAESCLAMAREFSRELITKLRLLRAAWGPAAEPLDVPGVRQFAQGLARDRLALSLDGLDGSTVFPSELGRVVLNLLVLASDSLPVGGTIALFGDASDLTLLIDGPRAAWPVGLARCIVSEAAAWEAVREARSVQMPMTVLLARSCGMRLSLAMGPSSAAAPPLRLTAV